MSQALDAVPHEAGDTSPARSEGPRGQGHCAVPDGPLRRRCVAGSMSKPTGVIGLQPLLRTDPTFNATQRPERSRCYSLSLTHPSRRSIFNRVAGSKMVSTADTGARSFSLSAFRTMMVEPIAGESNAPACDCSSGRPAGGRGGPLS